jgi:hypothetical protein
MMFLRIVRILLGFRMIAEVKDKVKNRMDRTPALLLVMMSDNEPAIFLKEDDFLQSIICYVK